MRKVAVFVEGQTELVFVREFLLKWFVYDGNQIGFECYNLENNDTHPTAFAYGSERSENYYLIVNVGNDNSVLSAIKTRLQLLLNKDYQVVVGLRDMYCKQYRNEVANATIKSEINELFISATNDQIAQIENGKAIKFHFAIMEIEAWLLGMPKIFSEKNALLTTDYIKQELNLDLSTDPETTIFHPAKELENIYSLVGDTYNKHLSDISSVMASLEKQDFISLIESGKCNSFKLFAESILSESFV